MSDVDTGGDASAPEPVQAQAQGQAPADPEPMLASPIIKGETETVYLSAPPSEGTFIVYEDGE